jgi:O-acetylhomoserine (thiol)-lyase
LNIAQAGDHIVASSSIYGGTYNLFKYTLPKLGINTTFVENQDDLAEWAAAVQPNTKAFFAETIGNPTVAILDIEGVAKVAHENGVPLLVDNTVATPYLIRPLEFGADIVIHSATKFLGGHGTVVAGAIVDGGKFEWSKSDKFPGLTTPDPSYHGVNYTAALGDAIAYIIKARVQLLRDIGASIAPASAWQLIQGIETLSLRVERHVANAQKIAEWLVKHPQVESVNYAGLPTSRWFEAGKKYSPKGAGAIVSFEIKGGVAAGAKFVDGLNLFSHVANIGDVRSLVIHPASTTHSQLTPEQQQSSGVTPGLIRLSVGLESVDDLIADLETAFQAAK